MACNWEEETSTVLLEMLIEEWIQIRCYSTATAWLEQYKTEKKKLVQKSKGIRKQLCSSASSKVKKNDSPPQADDS